MFLTSGCRSFCLSAILEYVLEAGQDFTLGVPDVRNQTGAEYFQLYVPFLHHLREILGLSNFLGIGYELPAFNRDLKVLEFALVVLFRHIDLSGVAGVVTVKLELPESQGVENGNPTHRRGTPPT